MSEGIVTFLLTKLGDFLLERGKQLETVKNEAEHVSDELAFNMKAFLRLADAMEESDSALKLLVKKVRDVAYDTEDALDELIRLCLANDNGHGVISCFRKIVSLLRMLELGVELLQKFKASNPESSVYQSHIGDTAIKITKWFMVQVPTASTTMECQRDALLLEEAVQKAKSRAIERLLGTKSGREVVSVVGIGGSGNTTLVKRVYEDKS
jgi:disease resistance protein RPM1